MLCDRLTSDRLAHFGQGVDRQSTSFDLRRGDSEDPGSSVATSVGLSGLGLSGIFAGLVAG